MGSKRCDCECSAHWLILHNQCIITWLIVSHVFMAEHLNRPFMDCLPLWPPPPFLCQGLPLFREVGLQHTQYGERKARPARQNLWQLSPEPWPTTQHPAPRSPPGASIAAPNNGAEMILQEAQHQNASGLLFFSIPTCTWVAPQPRTTSTVLLLLMYSNQVVKKHEASVSLRHRLMS